MTITPEIKNELADIVRQAMDQREERKATAKTVYRRICADFERELLAFNYSKPKEYVDNKGVKQQYNDESRAPRIGRKAEAVPAKSQGRTGGGILA